MDEIMCNEGEDWQDDCQLKPITNERVVDPELMMNVKKKRGPVENMNSLKRKHCYTEQAPIRRFPKKRYGKRYGNTNIPNNNTNNDNTDNIDNTNNNNSKNNKNNKNRTNKNVKFIPGRFRARFKKFKSVEEDDSSEIEGSIADDLDDLSDDKLEIDSFGPISDRKEQCVEMELEFADVLNKLNSSL